jgi:stearoyl-CoA desaturase (delta-9 desaturase)
VILAVALYVVVGHGVTIGFHRLLAHRSFEATRPL